MVILSPSGCIIDGPICKSAMSECMSTDGDYNESLYKIYRTWDPYCNLMISGHMMVSENAVAEKGNVVVRNTDSFKESLLPMNKLNTPIIAQLNHPGRQVSISSKAISVSNFSKSAKIGVFKTPTLITDIQLTEILNDFYNAATIINEAGWSGVQIHCAHGYLLSDLLHPSADSKYISIIDDLLHRIRNKFSNKILSLKLNLGDHNDIDHVKKLCLTFANVVDFIELSGGSYNDPVFLSENPRHKLFKEAVETLNIQNKMIFTGGFRTKEDVETALKSAVMVGIARPFCTQPHLIPNILEDDSLKLSAVPKINPLLIWFMKLLSFILNMPILLKFIDVAWCRRYFNNPEPIPEISFFDSLIMVFSFCWKQL